MVAAGWDSPIAAATTPIGLRARLLALAGEWPGHRPASARTAWLPAGSAQPSAAPGACKAGPFLPRLRLGPVLPPAPAAAFPAPGTPALNR
jgi:hypothetical protein